MLLRLYSPIRKAVMYFSFLIDKLNKFGKKPLPLLLFLFFVYSLKFFSTHMQFFSNIGCDIVTRA